MIGARTSRSARRMSGRDARGPNMRRARRSGALPATRITTSRWKRPTSSPIQDVMSERPDNDWGQDRIRLTLPNDIAHVAIARDTVRAAARRYDYSASDLDHWDRVIEEAVTDVIQLAFDPGERASFDIDCLQGATGLTVRIRDRGRPFNPRRIQPIALGGNPEATSDRGLGWHMMQRLMDVVTLEFLGREGQQLTLFKAA